MVNLVRSPFQLAGGLSLIGVVRKFSSLIVGAIFLCAGLPFLIFGVHLLRIEYLYMEHGVTTEGVVLTKSAERASGSRGTTYHVSYRFMTAEGVSLEAVDEVRMSLWESLAERERVNIRYLKEDPSMHRIEANISNRVIGIVFSLMGSLLVAIGGAVLALALKKILDQWKLSREGTEVEGTVVDIKPANLSINEVRQRVIRYTYRDNKGMVHEAESDCLSPEEAESWREGDKCRVLINPAKPEKSYWAGRIEAEEGR